MNRNETREYALVRRADPTDGEWEECSFCGYPAPLNDKNTVPELNDRGPEWLCCLCSNIVISMNPNVEQIQRTLCNVGNAILAALKGEQ